MSPVPLPESLPPLPSLLATVQAWFRMRRALAALRAGEGRKAADVLDQAHDTMNVDGVCLHAQAQLAAGRAGAARRALKEARKKMGQRLDAELDAVDADQLAKGGETAPFHLLAKLPRHLPGVTEFDGIKLVFPDGPAAFSAHQEIFSKRMYEIPPMDAPRIIDGGANIGLAAIFFSKRYPGARISCFEADPDVAVYLRKNMAAAGAEAVEVIEAALWSEDGSLTFSGEGSDAGRVGEGGAGVTKQVRAVRLSPYLKERIDLLKLDIEGAEMAVLRECRGALGQVQRIFVEYHSFEGEPQCLDELLAILREAGFRLAVTVSDALTQRPFIERGSSMGMDMRLNVFGYRDDG